MFEKIRRRLTMVYTIFTALFVLAFVFSSYYGLKMVIYREEEQEMRLFAEEEAREHVMLIKRPELMEERADDYRESGGKVFYFAYDLAENLINSSEPYDEIKPFIATIVPNFKKTQLGTVQLFDIDLPHRTVKVMIASQGIYDGESLIGTIYVGRDITSYYDILETYLLVLFGMGSAFLIMTYLAGHAMAGKAMEPIYKSFNRQKQFTADASHELRTPLTVLMASVDAVASDSDSSISPFAKQVLADMKDEIQKTSKIVSDLLTLARADAEVQQLYREVFNVSSVTTDVIRSLHNLATKRNICIKHAVEIDMEIFADKNRFYQLVYILLDNAIKYSRPNGRVLLTAKLLNGKSFILSVKDQGIGIAPEHQAHIFERFYREDKNRIRENDGGGAGLGLSIAKWIVEAHGGNIKVKSEAGVGTEFIVELCNIS